MDAKYVGARIAELRKVRGLTQKELAETLHITDGAVSKWERGINFPDLSLMEPLAAALDASVIQLLGLENVEKDEIANEVFEISMAEKKKLIKELKCRAILNVVIGLILIAALLIASKIFADNQIYGLAQICSGGMLGFIGTLIGSELYFLRSFSKL